MKITEEFLHNIESSKVLPSLKHLLNRCMRLFNEMFLFRSHLLFQSPIWSFSLSQNCIARKGLEYGAEKRLKMFRYFHSVSEEG